jgi:cyanophycinase-like exopeptidase
VYWINALIAREHPQVRSVPLQIVDGATQSTHSNIAEAEPDRTLSMYDVRLHVLSAGDEFDLAHRRPTEAHDLKTSQTLEARAEARVSTDIAAVRSAK